MTRKNVGPQQRSGCMISTAARWMDALSALKQTSQGYAGETHGPEHFLRLPALPTWVAAPGPPLRCYRPESQATVSYTHLTLPTICSV
eukprot:1447650-Alexandrium_andersonii.AAC.1